MTYSVKEIFLTLQGEGVHSGRAAVFLRFAGCNLWNGKEESRKDGKGDCRLWCDTSFVGTDGPAGGRFNTPEALAVEVRRVWDEVQPLNGNPFVVCTGGEPLLQLNEELIKSLHTCNFEVAVESNGTVKAPSSIDWLCVSPKGNAPIVQTSGNEIKIVYPQPGINPQDFEKLNFQHFFVSPKDGVFDSSSSEENLKAAIAYVVKNPKWRLSTQMHKRIGLP